MSEHLPAALESALAAFAERGDLLVALDFDGVLAPEVDRPEDARVLESSQSAITCLSGIDGVRVAFVSGRSMDSLVHVSGVPSGVLLAGSHGVEHRDEDGTSLDLTPDEQHARDVIAENLEIAARHRDGVWVEEKPAGLALHTRLASAGDATEAQLEAETVVGLLFPTATLRRGKNVREFAVRSTTKGDALTRLREQTGAGAVFFAGDDVTDEDGFKALRGGDLGVKVGDGETAAAHRVADPEAFSLVLERLAQVLADRDRGS